MSEREKKALQYAHDNSGHGIKGEYLEQGFLAGYDAGLEAAAERCEHEIVALKDGAPWATGVIDTCRSMATWIRAMKKDES